jgi:hypothetical protein
MLRIHFHHMSESFHEVFIVVYTDTDISNTHSEFTFARTALVRRQREASLYKQN